ncbi:adenylate kinase family enzyme [Rhodovulum iodosum]|uniref:Adenylate kinase family enzyme n=1 Tax=Rhodovulum iodosum TaxID=68291 RepID=A0ABV3XWD5_9RHOB|nr:AAA family ATPase [Rhodovulum robiginosum]RSK36797.1 hypothetical protein EJA01_04690 [Rhodovulum robiginosum]
MGQRIHITGASGVGCSTLARALADRLASQSFDTDDFFWRPSEPPFRVKRSRDSRVALMEEVFAPRGDWVLAGSLMGWGDALIPRLTHVIFLTLAPGKRLARLRRRERRRLGAAIAPGGALEADHRAFLDYAMGYDAPDFTGRNRLKHELWLAELSCPVIRLDAAPPVEELTAAAIAALDPHADSA